MMDVRVARIAMPSKIWTREEANRIPVEGLKLELINGELIDHMGKKPPHVYWHALLEGWLEKQCGKEYVRSQDPIDVAPEDNPTSEPEPDISVRYRSIYELRGRNPQPEDLRLVVEVSDSTFRLDGRTKAALYARAGIPEYWILDVRNAEEPRLLIHLEPVDGAYRIVRTFGASERFTVLDGRELCLNNL